MSSVPALADRNELSAFLELFADRHQTYVRSKSSNTWRTTSQWHYLSDEELFSSLSSDSSVRRAFGIMDKSKFLVIQIDGTKSPTAFQTTKNLQKQLRDTGLKPKTFYIEELELWQIFIFFADAVNTQNAITVAAAWLKNNWFDVDAEAVTILPSGAPFPIPLQASFNWLNDELVRVVAASEMSFQSAVSMFMQDLRANAVAYKTFENALLQVPGIQPIKDEVQEAVIDFTPSETSAQTVETDEHMDFSPIDAPISMVEKRDQVSSELEVERSVQTEDNDFEIAVLQLVQEHGEILKTEQGQDFCDTVQSDQLVQTDQTFKDFGAMGDESTALNLTEQTNCVEIQDCEKQQHDNIESGDLESPIFEHQCLEVFTGDLDLAEEEPPPVQPSIFEKQAESRKLTVQPLLFSHEDADERPPPHAGSTESKKSLFRKSSSRDGPEKKRKIVRTSQNADPDWDLYQQLKLPFETNTS